jgi:hypothetical protein
MSSIKKHFSVRTLIGLALGLAFSAPATFAGQITDVYATGQTLTTTTMDNIKSAVNDNNSRVTALETGAPPCPSAMSRVGSICIDTNLARVDLTGCSNDGATGCTNAAVSQSTGTAALATWAQAAHACANAGKRLPTPGEWVSAKLTAPTGIDIADGQAEWIDYLAPVITALPTDTAANTSSSKQALAGYIGSSLGTGAGADVVQMFANVGYSANNPGFINFRCAR